ncbi:hypothetical protein F8S13_25425 [Chloroflexia bacterium SDU3-3]|nr:hypothetical protein F8S13_25425 [Chloroflexia bacterium SDU3-3]
MIKHSDIPQPFLAAFSPSWSWCSHCHRAYLAGSVRTVASPSGKRHAKPHTVHICAYPDCDGILRRIEWPWSIYRSWHPDQPATPEQDIIYPA